MQVKGLTAESPLTDVVSKHTRDMCGKRCYLDIKTIKLRGESGESVKLGDLISFLILKGSSL